MFWPDCNHHLLAYTCLFNLTQQPALSINCGYAKIKNNMGDIRNIPIGLQIIGGCYKDELVLEIGHCLNTYFQQNPYFVE